MKNSQHGNAVVFILLAIALFGALSFAFLRGSKTGMSNLTANQAKLAAEEILSYATSFERTVNKLRQRGCSENELSYYIAGNSKLADYLHSPPARDECNLLHADGGALSLADFYDEGYLEPSLDWTFFHGSELVYFTVDGLGNTNGDNASKDLVFWVRGVKKPICEKINQNLGISTDLSIQQSTAAIKYNGDFSGASNTLANDFSEKYSGCFYFGTEEFDFYHVVLAR